MRQKFCSSLISNIALTHTLKLLNSGAQFTCFDHRVQIKIKWDHLEFMWGSVFRLQHRAAGQGTDPKSLIGAAEGGGGGGRCNMGETSKTSPRIRCFTLKCVPPPQSFVFAHYFFMGWFPVSEPNLWAQESWAPGDQEGDVCVLSARTDIRNVPSHPGDTSTLGGCFIVIRLTGAWQPVGSCGARFCSVCSPGIFASSCLFFLFMSNNRQSEDLWNRLCGRHP